MLQIHRYQPRFLAVDLQRQLLPGTFVHTMNHLTAKVIYLILYVGMCYVITDKCSDVIDILPANVMRWVNMHGSQDGDMEKHVDGIVTAIKGDARSTLSAGSGTGKEGAGRPGTADGNKNSSGNLIK